jgi:adenylosuccinate lyase
MGQIWSEENKYRQWLEVELTTSEALAESNEVPTEAAKALRRHADFDVTRIQEIEAEVKHDVIAFTTAVTEKMTEANAADDSRWLHFGLTSNDVVDTAQALQLKAASALIQPALETLRDVLDGRAHEFRNVVMVGRTHGVHAEPTTFGLKLANWYAEIDRHTRRFQDAAEQIRVGKISGAVGTFAHISPQAEELICKKLGLKAAPISSQIIQRDRHAHYLCTLGLIAATLEKIALEVRHLQRTEVREAQEYFSKSQKGSSAMPHKKNPITCEQICGLARVVRSNAATAFENIALWHERDISHSSVERIILPDSTILVDYLLAKTTNLIEKLLVYPERMRSNLESGGGLVFSGQVLLELAAKGVLREQAYLWVQRNAMRAWEEDGNFREMIENDSDICKMLSKEEIAHAFELKRQVRHVDYIFERVFGKRD